jgi:MFS superfamily sulfate permease-like transporter
MMDLVIGLLVGIASAAVLLIMWRAAERVRQQISAADDEAKPDRISRAGQAQEDHAEQTTPRRDGNT